MFYICLKSNFIIMTHFLPNPFKRLSIILLATACFACGNNQNQNKTESEQTEPEYIESDTPITLLPTKYGDAEFPVSKIKGIIHKHFNPDDHRHIKIHVVHNEQQEPHHLIVYLLHKDQHRVAVSNVMINPNYEVESVTHNYTPTQSDLAQQSGEGSYDGTPACPNDAIQFIAFCPNQDSLELAITNEVADTAEAHGLVTIRLLVESATRANYLNYMSCPNLIGNFYDGDANPNVITTHDGTLSYQDIESVSFRYSVTNYWLACEAYNDPMKSAVINTAETQKYAAGINNLLVGPSDRTAACAMIRAIQGEALTASFTACKDSLDHTADQWGYGGNGGDYFGQ